MLLRMALFFLNYPVRISQKSCRATVALLLAVTVLKNVLNSPSMWFFTLHITLVPALVIGVLYLLLAAVIPLIVLHFFNKGTVVERLRTSE